MILNYFQKTFTCLNNEGERIIVTKIPRKISVRQISTLHMKKVVRKGCEVFVVHIINNEQIDKEDKPRFDDIPILQVGCLPGRNSKITSKEISGFYNRISTKSGT